MRGRGGRRAGLVLGGAVVVVATLAGPWVPRAEASGIITHSWMAAAAIPLVDDADLRALLRANARDVEGGAHFPDSGYGAGQLGVEDDYGEEAHWPRFSNALADQIAGDAACGDLTAPNGPCARRIALLMGTVAHGMGDEVWDWLFEPNAPDRGESYVPPDLEPFFGTGGLEMQMDLIAIGDYDRATSPDLPRWPWPNRLAAAFAAVGRPDVSTEDMDAGQRSMAIARRAERQYTTRYRHQITANMPWTSAHIVTAPGGIRFAARAIAAAWESLWGRMLGEQPPTEVSITHPAAGQADVPATGWDRPTFSPGSAPDRGGAETRITAVLTASLPYLPLATSPGSIDPELPDGAMTLVEESSGDPVAIRDGYPRIVPYGPDSGEHLIDIQPDGDLEPCTTYRVAVTEALLDANGDPVVPYSWTFSTDGCPGLVVRPDIMAKRGNSGALVGDDVYGADGIGQGRLLRTPAGRTARFTLRLENDGNAPARLRVRGQRTVPRFTVRYFDGTTDVTARVVAGTYRTPLLGPGGRRSLRVEIRVGANAPAGAATTRLVTVSTPAEGSVVDGVRLTVRRASAAPRTAVEAAADLPPLSDAELAEAAQWLQVCSLE